MEENMLESDVDVEVILEKVQRKISSFLMNPQYDPILWDSEGVRTGRGLFLVNSPNIRNTPVVAQVQRDEDIEQLNRTMIQMHNEIIILRRGDDLTQEITLKVLVYQP